MAAEPHNTQLLGAYVLSVLDDDERRSIDAHLAECEACRAELAAMETVREALGTIPPEAVLEGPSDADLVLQKALRQVRAESAASPRRWVLATAAAVVLAVAVAGGVVAGRGTAGSNVAEPAPSVSGAPAPGLRSGSTVDPDTKVRMTAQLVPLAGWVRLEASIAGIPAGEKCSLLVVTKDGERVVAGGWVVSPSGENGTDLRGSAAVAPSDVVAVEVRNSAGKIFVTLPI